MGRIVTKAATSAVITLTMQTTEGEASTVIEVYADKTVQYRDKAGNKLHIQSADLTLAKMLDGLPINPR